jgi:hypothetical protein
MDFRFISERIKEITTLPTASCIAVMGAEMNVFAKRMLGEFYYIYVVESDEINRSRSRAEFDHLTSFCLVNGNAENTYLPDQSVDLILISGIAQRMDGSSVHHEFQRILRPPGWLAIVTICANSEKIPYSLLKKLPIVERNQLIIERNKLGSSLPSYLARNFTRLDFYDKVPVSIYNSLAMRELPNKLFTTASGMGRNVGTKANVMIANSKHHISETIDVIATLYLGRFSF